MSDMTPETRKEHWMARAAGEDELALEPQTREEHWWQKIIDAIESGGGGGGAVSSVNGKTGAVVLVPSDIGAEPQRLTVTVTQSGSTYSANKTFSEMWAAYNTSHKTVTVESGEDEFVLSAVDPSNMAFVSVSVGSGNATLKMLSVDVSDNWAYDEFVAGQITTTVSGTTPTITPAANTAYNCGELTSLTVSSSPASGAYSIVFMSGSTPTVHAFPESILGLEDFAAEANTLYEINVLDNRAVFKGWPLPAGE